MTPQATWRYKQWPESLLICFIICLPFPSSTEMGGVEGRWGGGTSSIASKVDEFFQRIEAAEFVRHVERLLYVWEGCVIATDTLDGCLQVQEALLLQEKETALSEQHVLHRNSDSLACKAGTRVLVWVAEVPSSSHDLSLGWAPRKACAKIIKSKRASSRYWINRHCYSVYMWMQCEILAS